jgi:hypothetical protein
VDTGEKYVAKFLRHQGHTFIHEPDGNIPPDFLVDGRIAVEVQRLIQKEKTEGAANLTETDIPLRRYLDELIVELGPPTHGASWYLYYRFRRPIYIGRIKQDLKRQLLEFRDSGNNQKKTVLHVAPNFKLEIHRAPRARKT